MPLPGRKEKHPGGAWRLPSYRFSRASKAARRWADVGFGLLQLQGIGLPPSVQLVNNAVCCPPLCGGVWVRHGLVPDTHNGVVCGMVLRWYHVNAKSTVLVVSPSAYNTVIVSLVPASLM